MLTILVAVTCLAIALTESTTLETTTMVESSSEIGGTTANDIQAEEKKTTTKKPTTTTTTTPPPPPALSLPCVCLGDEELLASPANTKAVLEVCRNNTVARAHEEFTPNGFHGFNARIATDGQNLLPERWRCGSRTVESPSSQWFSICNCTKKEEKAKKAFMTTVVLENQNILHRWDSYLDNDLKKPTSEAFLELKKSIEAAFDEALVDIEAAKNFMFVKTFVMSFDQGKGCMESAMESRKVCPKTTDPTVLIVTTTPVLPETTAGEAGETTGSSEPEATEQITEAGRRKREEDETTIPIDVTTPVPFSHYFVVAHMETQFMEEDMTLADFKALMNDMMADSEGDLGTIKLPLDAIQFSETTPTCPNTNLTDMLPTLAPFMVHDKPVSLKTVMETTEDGVEQVVMVDGQPLIEDVLELPVGSEIQLTCTDPIGQPSLDLFDLDKWDGVVSAVCQPDGTYNIRATQLGLCNVVCDQMKIPRPDRASGLEFTGLKRKGTSKLLPAPLNTEEFIWDGDQLEYRCKEEKYGIFGGLDRNLDRYSCKDTGTYNTPAGIHLRREEDREPWPTCQPQRYMVINAVEIMLKKYDFRISNRYKLIRYEEDDAQANIRAGPDHILEVTVPTVVTMLAIIMIALLCSKNDSLICRICSSKEA